MRFEITKEQQARVDAWLRETVYPVEIVKQKKAARWRNNATASDCWEMGYPYTGASGGGLTYEFTNTSIGQIQAATFGDHRLDLTDYGCW